MRDMIAICLMLAAATEAAVAAYSAYNTYRWLADPEFGADTFAYYFAYYPNAAIDCAIALGAALLATSSEQTRRRVVTAACAALASTVVAVATACTLYLNVEPPAFSASSPMLTWGQLAGSWHLWILPLAALVLTAACWVVVAVAAKTLTSGDSELPEEPPDADISSPTSADAQSAAGQMDWQPVGVGMRWGTAAEAAAGVHGTPVPADDDNRWKPPGAPLDPSAYAPPPPDGH
jgi:hypothetical protein